MIAAIEVVLYFDIPHKKGLERSPASVKDWTRGSTKEARSRDSFQRVFVPSSDWTQGLETLQVRARPLTSTLKIWYLVLHRGSRMYLQHILRGMVTAYSRDARSERKALPAAFGLYSWIRLPT